MVARWIVLIAVIGLAAAPSAGLADTSVSPNISRPAPKDGYSYPDCYCTDSDGQRVEMGEMACLRLGARRVRARCGMSQNSPAWRPQREGCPVS